MSRSIAGAVAAIVAAGSLPGCAYRVTLSSVPAADVVLPDGRRVGTPSEVVLRYVPFGHQRISVAAPGYRSMVVDLRRQEIQLWTMVVGTLAHPDVLWGRPRGEVRLLLVPEHGPAGTWTPDDLP